MWFSDHLISVQISIKSYIGKYESVKRAGILRVSSRGHMSELNNTLYKRDLRDHEPYYHNYNDRATEA
jgi:hypothetical protein